MQTRIPRAIVAAVKLSDVIWHLTSAATYTDDQWHTQQAIVKLRAALEALEGKADEAP
jgi:hypothetical protein